MRLIALLAALLVVSLAWAVGPPARPSPEVTRLIGQLGDDDPLRRKAAMTKLEAFGEPVLGVLRAAGRDHEDIDVRLRAYVVARAIEAKVYGELRRYTGHTEGPNVLSISPNGKTMASGSWHGFSEHVIRIWDVKTGKNTLTLKGHTGSVGAVAFLPDGKRLLSGGNDRTLRLWDVKTGKELRQMKGHGGNLQSVAISPDGKKAVSCCDGGMRSIYAWDLDKGEMVQSLIGHTAAPRGLAFLPGPVARCLSASWDGTVRLWEVNNGMERGRLDHGKAAWFVAARPDGKQAASVGEDGTLRFWDLEKLTLIRSVDAHEKSIHGVAYSPDGKRVLTCSYDHTMRLWDAETGRAIQVMEGHTGLAGMALP